MLGWKEDTNIAETYLTQLVSELDKSNRKMQEFLLINENKMSLETNDIEIWSEYKSMFHHWTSLRAQIEEVKYELNKTKQEYVALYG